MRTRFSHARTIKWTLPLTCTAALLAALGCGPSDMGDETTESITQAVSSNIAPSASVSTSFVSAWENVNAVKDGFTPANSNDNESHGAYGNWNTPNTYQWVQYDWSSAKTITKSEVYWYDDAGKRHLAADGYYIRSDQQTQEA